MSIDPVIWFFALGVIAGLAKSDLRMPPAIYDLLSMLLLLTIGLKGGVELAKSPLAGRKIRLTVQRVGDRFPIDLRRVPTAGA